jgi:DNA polymerase III alpha subunit
MTRHAELQVTSHFSFLRGASSCEELFAHAANQGIPALAVADRNSLAGIVRAHEGAKVTGIRLIVGCRLDLADGMTILVYPADRPACFRLCRLLSVGKKRGGKAKCILNWEDLVDWSEGLIAVLVPDTADDVCAPRLRKLRDVFGDRAYLGLTLRRRPNDQMRIHEQQPGAAFSGCDGRHHDDEPARLASASATTVSRCRTGAGTNSFVAAPASIHEACRRSHGTSTLRTCTSTASR